MEVITLDPSEVSTGRTPLVITQYVRAEGVNWGDAEIAAFMADHARGSTPVDFRVPNRQIEMPLTMRRSGVVPFATFRTQLQQKVARIQQEGGWIKRVTSNGGVVYADVVNATLHLGGSWTQAHKDYDIEASLRLETTPDWYGDEIALLDHAETAASELIWTETAIKGDYPGRVRIVVDEDQNVPQQGLLWGVRNRHYSNSTTARLMYEAETCTPQDAAVVLGGSIVHSNISPQWTPVMSTDQTGGASLTHTGTYRVWAKVQTTSFVVVPAGATALTPRVRLVWDVGDFALPSENEPVRIPSRGPQYIVSLGEVRLDRVPAGGHRWRGVVQAAGEYGGENFLIDKFWMQPVDEGGGVLRAPLLTNQGMANFAARDEFNQSGALTGKALPAGGTWQGVGGNGNDFTVDNINHWATRTAVNDGTLETGRFMTASGASLSDVAVEVYASAGASAVASEGSIATAVARWSSSTNFLFAYLLLQGQGGGSYVSFAVGRRQGGVTTFLQVRNNVPSSLGAWWGIRLSVDATGRYFAWFVPAGSPWGNPTFQGVDSALASGGALASGQVGFGDYKGGPGARTRYYDGFRAYVPQSDAVLFGNQSAELRTEGMFREDLNGVAYGPVSHVSGDLPRIPPAGAENRTTQFFLKASRGDFDVLPDSANDDISARVWYRPSYLLTP